MSREIPGSDRKARVGADDAAESFVIALWAFSARYPRNLGLEFAITAFSKASIGD
jgi:hypothetical protein